MRAQPTQPEPGWYPDPGRADDTWRWWSGTGWTSLLTTDEDAPAPDLSLTLDEVAGRPRRLRWRWITAIVTGAVVLVLLLAAVVSAALRLPTDELAVPRLPVEYSPAPTAAPAWSVAGSDLRFGTLATGAMPGAPYGAAHDFGSSTSCDTGVTNEVMVHDAPSWYAVVVSCEVDERMTASTLPDALRLLAGSLVAELYEGESLGEVTTGEVPGFTADEALLLTTRIDVTTSDTGNAYDELTLILVQPDPHVTRYALWASFLPEHVPDDVRAAVTDAQAALRHT